MNLSCKMSVLFPNVEKIIVEVVDAYSWDNNRLRKFSFSSSDEIDFFFACPMSKCFGNSRGVSYKQVIEDMVRNTEDFRQVELRCGGYGGYNYTFHCDWYVRLAITICYKK